jgi:hypothetical protein
LARRSVRRRPIRPGEAGQRVAVVLTDIGGRGVWAVLVCLHRLGSGRRQWTRRGRPRRDPRNRPDDLRGGHVGIVGNQHILLRYS